MPHQPTKALAAHYAQDAEDYRKLWAPRLRRASQHLLPALPLADAQRVLDIGTGVGTLLDDLDSAAPHATVAGVDLSAGMLRLADPRFGRAVMDAARLGLRSGSVDVATMCFMLFHLPDPLAALREAHRVLREGGTAGVITWGDSPGCPASQVLIEELDRHGAGPDPLAPRHDLVDTPAKVENLLRTAGFDHSRSWTVQLHEVLDVDQFLKLRSRLGHSQRRLETLHSATRNACLHQTRRRLQQLSVEDLTDAPTVLFATAHKTSSQRDDGD